MRVLRWFLFLPLCLSCGDAFMFSSPREPVKEAPGKVPCGGHFRIRQSSPEHAQGWLASKWLWFFFVVMLYMILKFRGGGEKSRVRGLRSARRHTRSWEPRPRTRTTGGYGRGGCVEGIFMPSGCPWSWETMPVPKAPTEPVC